MVVDSPPGSTSPSTCSRLLGTAHADRAGTGGLERGAVLAHVALGEDPDRDRHEG